MHRAAIILALLASAAAAAKQPPEPKQFLDTSVITFPEFSGEYTLAETHYDPEQWTYGVTSKWVVNAAPDDVRVSVFVYPIGRISEEQAVSQQIADVERGMQQAVEQGIYTDLVVGERGPFVVVAPASSIVKHDEGKSGTKRRGRGEAQADRSNDLSPKPELSITAGDTAGPMAAALAASLPSPNNHGQRQSFRFSRSGVPVRSLGYVFYRHLFAFKVRVTAPADSMDDATFDALADTATRVLVPGIDVKNYGLCGNINLSEPDPKTGKKTASDAMAQELILNIARVRADNCATAVRELSAEESRGGKRVEIVYPPDIWKTSD